MDEQDEDEEHVVVADDDDEKSALERGRGDRIARRIAASVARRGRLDAVMATLHCLTHCCTMRMLGAAGPSVARGVAVALAALAIVACAHVLAACAAALAAGCFSSRPVVAVLLRPDETVGAALETAGFCARPSAGFEADNLLARCASWCPPAARILSTRDMQITAVVGVLVSLAALMAGAAHGAYRMWKVSQKQVA